MLYGLLPVSVMRVFLFGCRWPCTSVTVGCSSLSPGAERVLNLDVTQGEGEAASHKGLVSGRPIVNKGGCFSGGGDFRQTRHLLCPRDVSKRLSRADTAVGNNPGIHSWPEVQML